MKTVAFRSVSLCVIIGLAAPAPLAPAAMAQPTRDVRVVDGQPGPDNCRNFGFRNRVEESESGYSTAQALNNRALRSPQARPAPPPPPLVAPRPPVVMPSPSTAPAQPSPPPAKVFMGSSGAGAPAITAYSDRRLPDTETYPDAVTNPIRLAEAEPVSTFSIDVDTAAYANVRRFLGDGQRPPRDAVRVEELVNYFDYNYRAPETRDPPFATYLAVAPSPWAKGKQLIHIGVQGFKPKANGEPPLNLVFLVDTSGSMSSPDRLPLAQKALNVLIDQLRPQDRVSLVAYAGSAGAVLSPTDGRQKLKIRCAVNYLESGGSTAGGAGLNLAYSLAQQNFDKNAVNRVILMTDGDFNVGVTSNKTLEQFIAEQRKTGIYLSVYGFGRGNYQDARMQVLAQNGNGTAAYVDSFDEARKLFRDDFSKSLFPIADDVKIQVEFNPAMVIEYRLIGYETRMLTREDFNNDAVDAGEVSAGASVTALYEITPRGGRTAIDPLRYGSAAREPPENPNFKELAYLKIRYKLPGGSTSKLISVPITGANTFGSIALAPEQTRWAAAVAAYGQKLRGDPYMAADFGWDNVLALAQSARGEDLTGVRAQFVQLTRSAKDVQARTELGAR
ncbi:hypothetical protein BH11PSE2_BH11PSE2_06540 [soil metagenome]